MGEPKLPPLVVTIQVPPPPTIQEVSPVAPTTAAKTQPTAPAEIPLPIEHLTLIYEATNSTHAEFPYALKLTIQSTISENPIALNIWFDNSVKSVKDLSRMETGMVWLGDVEIAKPDPRCVIVGFTANGQAMLRPDRPIIFRVESDQPLHFVNWRRKLAGTWQDEKPMPQ